MLKKNKKKIKIQSRRTNTWIQIIFVVVFEILPALLMWFFLSKDWIKTPYLSYGATFGLAILFLFYVLTLVLLFIWWKIIWVDTFNFALPIAIILMGILVTYPLPNWSRALIIIPLIAIAWPINMITASFVQKDINNQIASALKGIKKNN